jgi:sugar lactone lactonase YvrE
LNELQEYTDTGSALTFDVRYGGSGSAGPVGSPVTFNGASGDAMDGTGDVYVTDSGNGYVQKVNSSGNVVWEYHINQVVDCASYASGGVTYVYVTSPGNFKVYRLQDLGSSVGTVISWGSFGSGDGEFDANSGIAVSPGGNVYVCDGGNSRIQEFDGNGNFILTWGSNGTGPGQFNVPTAITIDSSGYIYIGEQVGTSRVQKFAP